ncbi:MAG: PEP-CTERM sorting domain-containing protein [Rubrivivax sp.]|nr:PEP-CTERM sorting domain-containing protein [Rubrivivax sp.]
MFKFSKIVSAVALAVAGVAANAGVVIDDFSFDQATASTNVVGGSDATSAGSDSSILGGYRDLAVTKTAGGGSVSMGVADDVLSYASSSGQAGAAQGTGLVRWDGANTLAGVDADGLDDASGDVGVELNIGAVSFLIDVITADQTFDLTFSVWTDKNLDDMITDGEVDSFTTTIMDNFVGQKYVSFSNFGTANFSRVGALQLMIDGTGSAGSLDFTVDIIQAVPEPGSLALAGLALAGLGMARRRKATAK